MIATAPITTPPTAAAIVPKAFTSHPSFIAALGVVDEEPALPDPDGEDEVGALPPPPVTEGVKTPPEGSWAIQDEAADAASSAVLGPANVSEDCQRR